MRRSMRLPYFPLHQVLFPHLPLPLHVFEERYRALARDVVAEGSPFGGRFVVSMITEGREVGGDAATQPIGTICEVHSAEQFPDGRWLLLVVGVARARLGAVDRSGPYPLVEAHELPERQGDGAASALPAVQQALDAYLDTVKRFVAATASGASDPREPRDVTTTLDQVLKPIHLPDDPSAASYAVAGVLQVELSRKQHLLELPDAATRLRAELEMLRRESRLLGDGATAPVPAADLGYHPN
jgi:Lon protease-like protein